jgi:TolB protein
MRLNDNENQAAFITKFSDGSSADRMGKFSPDGKTLAWSRQTNPENPISQIFAAEISTPLSTKALTKMTGSSLHPSWHPNGELIIFSSNAHRGTFNLYSVDRAGTCVKRLTEVEVDQLHPSFSPDGKQILFTGQKETRSQIYLMEFDPPTECLAGAAANSIP